MARQIIIVCKLRKQYHDRVVGTFKVKNLSMEDKQATKRHAKDETTVGVA